MGTALIVIIPEGVETLYSASGYGDATHVRRSFVSEKSTLMARSILHHPKHQNGDMRALLPREPKRDEKEKAKASDLDALPGPVIPPEALEDVESDDSKPPSKPPAKTPTEPGKVGILGEELSDAKDSEPSRQKTSSKADTSPPPRSALNTEREPHAWIGLSLALGFILMYLLDTLPLLAPSGPTRPSSNIYSLSDLSTSPVSTPAPPQRSLSTTLGLCIHAAADGIALGASSSSSSTTSLSLIIFVAIMVHKAPAAFGLTSVLLKQGLGKRSARAHLLIFSLAAPAGAVATWILVRALGGGGESEPAVMRWWTGVLLLFSGGTFL